MTIFDFQQKMANLFYKVFVEWTIKVSLGRCGKRSRILHGFSCYGIKNTFLGNRCSIGENCRILATRAKVVFGDDVIFGPNVTIVTGNHRFDVVGKKLSEIGDQQKTGNEDQDVIFCGDNWVGANATILKGVTIGEGAVIGAGSLVTKNVPAYSVVGGNPAKVLKMRFTNEQIIEHEKLLAGRKQI
jgi:acetyltransferase-like isoleucine patch superfamily enzyme